MLWFAISVKDNFVLYAPPREYLALWGLRVLPDKSAFVGPQMPCLRCLFRKRDNELQIIKTPNKKIGDNQSPTEF